ncbi:unnamed protein product [Dibothriocephalus latus]|uniref:Uncharacterized protein n=1 Tax=Dibothriocephalus latus TaxID=60516 RepID=A0A3P6V0G7_DIBLA|nr:unnamed protein product [Dibothriocephalus latus]
MIIPTVLGCVAAIFAWILQYQNGGLLNVFMKPVRSSDSPNVTFDVVSDFSGILAFIACLVFASLGLVVIFIFSFICCICCCCCDSGCHHDEDEDEKDELGSKASTKDQNFICCGLHILALVVTTLLLIGLAVCIGYYFGAANVLSETMADSKAKDVEVVSWLEGNSSSFSVGRILQFFVSNALKFSKSSISSAKTNINVTVSTVKTTILKVCRMYNSLSSPS